VARARILATADRLFYGEGIRSVGVDRVVAEAKVTRVTFYRHFPSKDHLIAAYLQGRLERDRSDFEQLRASHSGDPRGALMEVATRLADESGQSGFRGCAYLNVTTEFCDSQHPSRDIAIQHRQWLLGALTTLLEQAGHARPAIVAEQLVMLRAGAMAVSSVHRADGVARAFRQAWSALIDHQ
jgi:AcrR family transcriptional regulator